MTLKPGLALAGIFLCIYGTLALAVNLPKATVGFKSDEATYYMIGLSFAYDWDVTYRKEDLVRVWREFPAGPAGVFLKLGQKLDGTPDPDQSRYFYGKSFIYPLFATPLIWLFGTEGFLVLNALMLALVLLCGYLFLHARAGPWPSAILSAAFVMASVVPVYVVQIMPEVFNFSLAFLAYFCWLYKEVASPERSPRGTRWLFTPRSDLVMAILLGIVTFSKPTNALLFGAPFLWGVFGIFRLKAEATEFGSVASGFSRKIHLSRKILLPTIAFLAVGGGLFAINTAIMGDWNYQGGGAERRKSYYFEFPFQTEGTTNKLGIEKSRDDAMTDVIFNPRTVTSNLLHNLCYFFVGRHAGLLPYFFVGLFSMLAMLAAPRKRPGWQWLVLGAALAQGLIFIITTPYTWSGGGVGNRYFFAGYGVMLFLLPPIESVALAFLPWAIGGLFVAPMVISPFSASFRPADNAKSGPVRMLPVELTLLNDLPVFTEPERGRVWFGEFGPELPGFLVSFLDDNAYGREEDRSFWTRGDSRADLVFKANTPIRRAIFELAAGPVPVSVTIKIGGRRQDVDLAAAATQRIVLPLSPGLPYEKEVADVQLWNVTITTRSGFTPIFFDAKSSDPRYLGVRVKPMLESRPQ